MRKSGFTPEPGHSQEYDWGFFDGVYRAICNQARFPLSRVMTSETIPAQVSADAEVEAYQLVPRVFKCQSKDKERASYITGFVDGYKAVHNPHAPHELDPESALNICAIYGKRVDGEILSASIQTTCRSVSKIGVHCLREPGHEEPHQNCIYTWYSDPSIPCGEPCPDDANIRCSHPSFHTGLHGARFNGIDYRWSNCCNSSMPHRPEVKCELPLSHKGQHQCAVIGAIYRWPLLDFEPEICGSSRPATPEIRCELPKNHGGLCEHKGYAWHVIDALTGRYGTCNVRKSTNTRCCLLVNHLGRHINGGMKWSDPYYKTKETVTADIDSSYPYKLQGTQPYPVRCERKAPFCEAYCEMLAGHSDMHRSGEYHWVD